MDTAVPAALAGTYPPAAELYTIGTPLTVFGGFRAEPTPEVALNSPTRPDIMPGLLELLVAGAVVGVGVVGAAGVAAPAPSVELVPAGV